MIGQSKSNNPKLCDKNISIVIINFYEKPEKTMAECSNAIQLLTLTEVYV